MCTFLIQIPLEHVETTCNRRGGGSSNTGNGRLAAQGRIEGKARGVKEMVCEGNRVLGKGRWSYN